MIIPRYDLTAAAQQSDLFFSDNRLIAGYLAIEALFRQRITVSGRVSYSSHAGSYVSPYPKPVRQFSAAIQVVMPVTQANRNQVYIAVATDQGNLLARSTGAIIGFQTRLPGRTRL